jgi:hypothetical protein
MLNRHGFVILCISEKTPPIMATGGVFHFYQAFPEKPETAFMVS